jgi:hypothetical protein
MPVGIARPVPGHLIMTTPTDSSVAGFFVPTASCFATGWNAPF